VHKLRTPAILSCLLAALCIAGAARADGPCPDGPSQDWSGSERAAWQSLALGKAFDAARDTGADAEAPCAPAGSLLCNPLGELPASLADTGFFPVPGNLDMLAPNVFAFEPSLQLWSDGLHKKRQVILPRGKKIGVANRAVEPVGGDLDLEEDGALGCRGGRHIHRPASIGWVAGAGGRCLRR